MSALRLTVRDSDRSISAECPAAFADSVVAALSAEPETIEELERAILRFQAPGERSCFAGFRPGINDEPYDAGVLIVDLAARVVVCDSTYSAPGTSGTIDYHDGRCATDDHLQYHLPDDWLFLSELENWQGWTEPRRTQRRQRAALDARAVLDGAPMLRAIAGLCWKAFRASEALPAPRSDREYDLIRALHAQWMLTPRDDLHGQAPRDVMLAQREFLEQDLQDREFQWTVRGECPPGLDPASHAFRFGGFGTHEIVTYYELVRDLLWSCRRQLAERNHDGATRADSAFETLGDFLTTEVPRLERVREEWLETPDPEFHGRTPRSIIDRERARIPEGVTGAEAVVDHDCPLCQMSADMPGPMFWHRDGCNMDRDFAFSFHRTREEWEEEEREFEEFNGRFDAERAEQERLGVRPPGSGYAHPDSVWRRSFVAADCKDGPLEMRLFAIGSHLCELIVDLRQPAESTSLIDQLRRDFGNLREVARSHDGALASALLAPVVDRFCETLDAVGRARADLQAKCDELQQRLRRFLEPPSAVDRPPGFFEDDDIPF